MTLRQQFREVFHELRLVLEGRSQVMTRAELADRSITKLAWVFAPAVALMAVAAIVAALA